MWDANLLDWVILGPKHLFYCQFVIPSYIDNYQIWDLFELTSNGARAART
jgi:hypothetical protein